MSGKPARAARVLLKGADTHASQPDAYQGREAVRSMLTVACLAASLGAGTMFATRPSPAAAAPPEESAAPADTTEHSTADNEFYSVQYFRHHARPVLGIQYGFGDVERDGFTGDLASIGAFDVQAGFRMERRFGGVDALLHQSTNFAYVGNLASRLASDLPSSSEVGTDMWRFGLGFADGYGYRFASNRGRFVLQSALGFGWYSLDVDGGAVGALPPVDAAMLEQFTSHTRFGDSWESAVEVGFGENLAVHAGYERSVVFPGFKIWYWAMSSIIDRIALEAVDLFVDRVEDSSPYAAPVVRFVLEGALQYGFYELRQEETNWPFNTEPPLAYDMFKLGLTTRF